MALALGAAALVTRSTPAGSQSVRPPDWSAVEAETMRHYQALLRLDTRNPPGNERLVVDYLRQVLEREGIPVSVRALDPARPNLVARLAGTGRKRPLLLMGHSDVVGVDSTKWPHPPFGATREGGYVYGRGALDDRDNIAGALMTLLLLKRQGVRLDRDVIFLAEAGEEGSTRVGVEFMTNEHFTDIDAEYCLAEGNGARRVAGLVTYVTVLTMEKRGRAIELTARGTSGHGSVPLPANAVVRLAAAVARVGTWQPEVRLNATTRAYFERLADLSAPDLAQHYRAVVSDDAAARATAVAWLFEHEPGQAAMLRTSVAPTNMAAGQRTSVIPSEAKATLDVRLLPDEDPDALLARVRSVVADSAVEVRFAGTFSRPAGGESDIRSDAFRALEAAARRVYGAPALPLMSAGATDMAFLRAKGVQCYGVGPAVDVEDMPRGFGPHADQERLLESELHRFVRFLWDAVVTLARGP